MLEVQCSNYFKPMVVQKINLLTLLSNKVCVL